ncbi:MAG TPA: ATP-binding protein [Methylophilaceae bacterium]|nr:ATP-binding protein [Methylophilaceae bacterium]
MAHKPKSLKNLLLVHELTFIFLIVLAGMAGATGIHYWQQASHESLRINQLIQEIQQTRGDLYRQMKELFDAFFLDDTQARAEYDSYTRSVEQHFRELRGLAVGEEEKQAISELQLGYTDFLEETGDLLQRHSEMPSEALRKALNTDLETGVFSRFEAVSTRAERLLTLKQQELQQKLEDSKRNVVALMVIPLLLASLLLVFSRFFLKRAIVRPISDILYATSEISAGRLEHKAPAESRTAELAMLAGAINQMASELARSQEALVRSEKQAAQGALVPMLAHNIRNPLASIRATAQVADEPGLHRETREALYDIIGTVDRLERWTGGLLAYLHPLRPQPVTTSLQSIIHGALAPLQQKLREKSIDIELAPGHRNDKLSVDEQLLEQALYNLLLNAVDASPASSAITIEYAIRPEQVELRILDRGPGMPFSPAPGNLSPGPSTKRFGTGLGIPFAFKVCEALGGSIEFTAREGGGTSVKILLPHGPRA